MRSTAYNSVYVSIASEVVNRMSVPLKDLMLSDKVRNSNLLLHIYANR